VNLLQLHVVRDSKSNNSSMQLTAFRRTQLLEQFGHAAIGDDAVGVLHPHAQVIVI
jgi:hypothetical protein